MRQIDYIILHCTAGPQTQTVENILHYWKSVLGWNTPGYHYMIKPDGEAVNLVPIEKPSNGVKGFNAHSINISYIGGVQTHKDDPVNAYGRPIDNRTPQQLATMRNLVERFSTMFPSAIIQGHRDFSPDKNRDGIIEPSEWMKTCPSFSVKKWLDDIGFRSKFIAIKFMTSTPVNLREGAGTNFPVMQVLPANTPIRILASAADWSYIKLAGTETKGWIVSRYIK
jgi:N-acetylmuramoyl-L-alanine amidase